MRANEAVPASDLATVTPDGKDALFEKAIRWARKDLFDGGEVASPARGIWALASGSAALTAQADRAPHRRLVSAEKSESLPQGGTIDLPPVPPSEGQGGRRISLAERPRKYCPACATETPWNSHNRCMVCQRKRSKEYSARTPRFSVEVKRRLVAEHPERCPRCSTAWSEIKPHAQHPNTPWHFDHHVSPQHGGDNSYENARIICWPCNLGKLNKLPAA